MKTHVLLVCCSLLTMPALAATPQQQKMKACNADAAKQSLKGDARKAFMKHCLGAKANANGAVDVKADAKVTSEARVKSEAGDKAETRDAIRPMTAQQQKMKQCNADAKVKQLKGVERKQFMSACLRSKRES